MQRDQTAASIVGIGMPSSSAFGEVQRPVPFCSASSRIRSTSGLPVSSSVKASTLAVISIRYEFSRPSFQRAKIVAISGAGQAERVLHNVVGLGDQLHIAVFDAVVDHLDIVAGAAWADVRDAGPVLHLAAIFVSTGSTSVIGLLGPPGIRLGPCRAPSSPPLTPMPTK